MKRWVDEWGAIVYLIGLIFAIGVFYAKSESFATREEAATIAERIVAKDATSKSDGAVILSRLDSIAQQLHRLEASQQYLIGVKQLPE